MKFISPLHDRITLSLTHRPMHVHHNSRLKPIRTTRKYGPYIRPIFTGAFLTPVYTANIYRCTFRHPYTRVSNIHPHIRAVNTTRMYTGRIYGPYLRVVRIGLNSYTLLLAKTAKDVEVSMGSFTHEILA